jgi:hypothetical protein
VQRLIGRKVFSTARKDYYWEHVFAAAILSGEWAKLETRTRVGLACYKRMEATEEYPDQEELDTTAAEFRYARNLISAEEAESWLARMNLSADDWMNYILRSLLMPIWEEDLEQTAEEYPISSEEISASLYAQAVCSGDLTRFGQQLAGRVAVTEIYTDDSEPITASPLQFPECPFAISAPRWEEIQRDLAFIEAGFKQFYEKTVTPQTIADEIKLRGGDLILFELDTLELPTQTAAKEALFCITEDGLTLAEVAKDTGFNFENRKVYYFEMDVDGRDAFLAKQAGEMVGPLKRGEAFQISLIRNREMPSPQDPDVARLAEKLMLERITQQEVNNRIKWDVQF